jgi:tetratricopeptide (TPR) repeat protein
LSALKLDSTFSLAYNAMGKMFHQEGNDLEASHYFSKELTYNPSNISTNLLLAQIYEKQSRGDLAIPLLERVLKKDTSNKSVKSNLEKLYVTFPDRRPKAIVDTTVKKAPAIDTSNKPKTPEVVKKDTVKKTNPVKPIEKPKEVKKENKVLIPKIFNPDSTKIEKRPDSLK